MTDGFLDLVRILQAPAQADDEIRILALELYEDGFIVRWATPVGRGIGMPESPGEATLNPLGLVGLSIRDDLGTAYEMVGMQGGSTHGLTMYRPAIPREATRLEVFTKGGIVPFDLADGR